MGENHSKLISKQMNTFKVNSEECIGCKACVMVAANNFEMNDENIAYVKKQPKNHNEDDECVQALEVCPVDAISSMELIETLVIANPVVASDIIKTTLDTYPQLKPVLTKLSPKFKKLQIPAMYNTIARFATFRDAAKLAGLSVCEILHALNKELGMEHELIKNMPECISSDSEKKEITGEEITWEENSERYIYNVDVITEIMEKVSNLQPQESIVIISVEKPDALLKTVAGLGLKFNIGKNREYRISIFNPEAIKAETDWTERKEDFEQLDVRNMQTDPFDIIIIRSYEN